MKSDNTSSDILAKGSRIEKIIIAFTAVIIIAAFALVFLNRGRITAITMRIIEFKGNVLLEESGRVKAVKKNARLNSEDVVSTESGSGVKIGLDEAKIVSLEENSRASVSKTGRRLELMLESGRLNFEVSKPLEADETLNIKTTTMIVGIRGTAGTVSSIGDLESVEITDGVVHVTVTNPVTGETKKIDVHAGEKITVNSDDGSIIDNTEVISESPIRSDADEAQQENGYEAEDPVEEDPSESGEISDEPANPVQTGRGVTGVTVEGVLIRFDMTIGEAVEALQELDGGVGYYENSKHGVVEVYRKIPDPPPSWYDGDPSVCTLWSPEANRGGSMMDAPVAKLLYRQEYHIFPGYENE